MKRRLESLVEQWQDTEYWQENQEHIIILVGTCFSDTFEDSSVFRFSHLEIFR